MNLVASWIELARGPLSELLPGPLRALSAALVTSEPALRLAQVGEGGPQGSPLQPLLLFGALGLVFYAFVIRPQRQQDKAQREMREALKRGDQVVTTGGLHGKITGLSDDVVTLEIADRVRVKVSRVAIASSRSPGSPQTGQTGAGEGKA